MKTRILLSAAVVVLLALVLISCSDNDKNSAAVVVFPTVPKFLIAVDGNGAGTNVNVFPINATTGVLGAVIAGSPFNLGLTRGMTMTVHPNGRFVYTADGVDGSIHAWSVDETTGIPTQIAAPVINESGTFYQPTSLGDSATHVITITPKGCPIFRVLCEKWGFPVIRKYLARKGYPTSRKERETWAPGFECGAKRFRPTTNDQRPTTDNGSTSATCGFTISGNFTSCA